MSSKLLTSGLLLVALAAAAALGGQVPRFSGGYARAVEGELPEERTGFTFCRLVFDRTYSEQSGSGWNTDYPMADQNLMIRLSELTKTDITRHPGGDPAHALVRGSDSALYGCPFLYAADAGTMGLHDDEVEGLRQYLLKGGFLWVDDFWGNLAWSRWLIQIGRVLPEYDVVEVPLDHPIFSAFYFVDEVPQIPSIQSWRRSGGETSERGFETAIPRMSGIFDERGRLLVLMTHNTDIADGWEREGEDYQFFHLFSPRGYSVGINVVIFTMTH